MDEAKEFTECCIPGCERKFRCHMWAKRRAQSEGWYFTKSGRVFCPEHGPYFRKASPT